MKDGIGTKCLIVRSSDEIKSFILAESKLEKPPTLRWTPGTIVKHKTTYFLFCNTPKTFESCFKKLTNTPKTALSFQYGNETGMLCQEFVLSMMMLEEMKKVEEVYLFEKVVVPDVLQDEAFCSWFMNELKTFYLFEVGEDVGETWRELEKCKIINLNKLIDRYQEQKTLEETNLP